jgi:hypothetical protein
MGLSPFFIATDKAVALLYLCLNLCSDLPLGKEPTLFRHYPEIKSYHLFLFKKHYRNTCLIQ